MFRNIDASIGISKDKNYCGQALFTAIAHPHLEKYGKPEVRNCLKTEKCICLPSRMLKLTELQLSLLILASIDKDLLDGFVFFQCFGPEVTSLDQATNEISLSWLKHDLVDNLDDLSADKLMNIVRANVHMKRSEPDAAFRVRNLILGYQNILVQRHWESFIIDCPKVAVERIFSLLKPEAFKNRVQSNLTLTKKSEKDWKGFCDYLVTEAVNFGKF